MPVFTQLTPKLLAFKYSDFSDELINDLKQSALYLSYWHDEAFYYIQDPKDVKQIQPIFFRTHQLVSMENTDSICEGCTNRNRLALSSKTMCDHCSFTAASKESFDLNSVLALLKQHSFVQEDAQLFYHSVFKRSDSCRWSGKQFHLQSFSDKIRVHSANSVAAYISFPLWRFSKTGKYLNAVHPYIKLKVIPKTPYVRTDEQRNATTEYNISIIGFGNRSGKKAVMDEAYYYINGFDYSMDIDASSFPISIPYQFTRDELHHLSIEKTDHLKLALEEHKRKIYIHDGFFYEPCFPNLETCIEHYSDRTFNITFGEDPKKKLVFDGKTVYKQLFPADAMEFTVDATDHYEKTIKIAYYKSKGNFKTIKDAMKILPEPTYMPSVYLPELTGFQDIPLSEGDSVLISNPVKSHEKLFGQIGLIRKMRDEQIDVDFLNGYLTETFNKNEIILYKPKKIA